MTESPDVRALLRRRRSEPPARWPSQRAAAALSPEHRAERLLAEHLTVEQADTLATFGWFDVISQHGSTYRIYRGQVVNVYRLASDRTGRTRPVVGYCLRADDRMPDADVMLTQLLLLRTDEDAFVDRAERSHLRPPRRPR